MSANCQYYQELMSRMLDGDLLPAETAALREHIRACPECRHLCAAFSGMALSLREDEAEPPAALAQNIMDRIRACGETDAPTGTGPEPIPLRRREPPRSKAAGLRPLAAAACLVLVIGAGTLAAFSGRGTSSRETAEAPAAAYSRATADSAANEAAEDVGMEAPAEPMAEEGAAPAEPMMPAPEPGDNTAPEAPASVPEGCEEAFEALLSDAGVSPQGTLHPIFYVEHSGVIYEFITDEEETLLLWRDAAEGFPTVSRSSPDDLWTIFR